MADQETNCPACAGTLALAVGHLGEDACLVCGCRFFGPEAAAELRTRFLGITVETQRELAGHYAGGAVPCVHCRSRMHRVPLRGEWMEVCHNCGSALLRKGQLAKLSEDTVAEITGPPSSSTPQTDLNPVRFLAWIPLTLAAPELTHAVAKAAAAGLADPLGQALGTPWMALLSVQALYACVVALTTPVTWAVSVALAPAWKKEVSQGTLALCALVLASRSIAVLHDWGLAGLLVPLMGGLAFAWVWRLVAAGNLVAKDQGSNTQQAVTALSLRVLRRAGAGTLAVAVGLGLTIGGAVAWSQFSRRGCPRGTVQTAQRISGATVQACVLPDGTRHGAYTKTDVGGVLLEQGQFVRGKRQGRFTASYADGSPNYVANYDQGQRTGLYEQWYPNGQLRLQGAYESGRRHGPWMAYHPNGRPRVEAYFMEGRRSGRWAAWTPQGEHADPATVTVERPASEGP